MSKMVKQSKLNTNKSGVLNNVLNTVGLLLIIFSALILVLIFFPVIKEEFRYNLNIIKKVEYVVNSNPTENQKELTPPNKDFSIIIPRIGVVAPVVANVDWQNPSAFLPALKKGVAHARGTAFPGEEGNSYIFAHSTDAFYNVGEYNAIFYLLGKLREGDEIDVFYKSERYIYKVYEVKVVEASEVKYLGKIKEGKETLTLQTCYPPGTTLKRLVVLAEKKL